MQDIIEKLKNPVSTCLEKMREEDLKRGLIKGAIIAVVMAIISAISKVITTFSTYSKIYSYYDSAKKSEKVWEEIKDLEIFSGIFQSIVITAIAIAFVALILFVIAKVVKSPKKYEEMLSLINNVTMILVAGQVIQAIVSLIYLPLAILISMAIGLYTFFTLIFTFKECIEIEESNTLVLAITGVITAMIAIIMILITVLLKDVLGDISDIFDIMSIM